MNNSRILFLTDNRFLFQGVMELSKQLGIDKAHELTFACSPTGAQLFKDEKSVLVVDVKNGIEELISNFDLIFSLHSKQFFPKDLITNVRCINIHPGLNPYNRGWYPQVFSIINNLPAGVTIHEMDEYLDHGPIICQAEVKIMDWDTSLSVYTKLQTAELELLALNLQRIIGGEYKTTKAEEGNINHKIDFENIRELDLSEVDSFKNHINKLRALSHGDFENAFFYDDQGNKIIIRLELIKRN